MTTTAARLKLVAALTPTRTFITRDATALNRFNTANGLLAILPLTFAADIYDRAGTHDVAITSGLAVLTSASNPWTAADVGKKIYVQGAGVAGATLTTTILAYTSAGQVTLAANAGTTVAAGTSCTAGVAVWGSVATVTDTGGDAVAAAPSTGSSSVAAEATARAAADAADAAAWALADSNAASADDSRLDALEAVNADSRLDALEAASGGGDSVVWKAADQDKTGGFGALAADNNLKFAMLANEVWIAEITAIFLGTGENVAWSHSVPAGCTDDVVWLYGKGTGAANQQQVLGSPDGGGYALPIENARDGIVRGWALLKNGATPGDFSFLWDSQIGGEHAKLQKGSYIKYRKLA